MSQLLHQGQTVELVQASGGSTRRLRMGLGWDSIRAAGPGTNFEEFAVDLDASALLVAADKRVVETVYYGHLSTVNGSLVHTGDNQTGVGEGDDECIDVDLSLVSVEVAHIVFVVTSYSGQSFQEIENATARILDLEDGGRELFKYILSGSGGHDAVVMARISRSQAGWTFTAIGSPGDGRTARELIPTVMGLLGQP